MARRKARVVRAAAIRERANVIRGYLPNQTRTNVAVGLLLLVALFDLIEIGTTSIHALLAGRVIARRPVNLAVIDAIEMFEALGAVVAFAAFVGTVIAFCLWIHRARQNVAALGARGLRFTPGWAVGYFFIPIYSFFRPYQVMREIWQASDPETDVSDHAAWQKAPRSGLVSMWWALFLLMNFAAQSAFRAMMAAETPEAILSADYVTIGADIIAVAAAAVTIALVRSVEARQTQRAAAVAAYLRSSAAAQPAAPGPPGQLPGAGPTGLRSSRGESASPYP